MGSQVKTALFLLLAGLKLCEASRINKARRAHQKTQTFNGRSVTQGGSEGDSDQGSHTSASLHLTGTAHRDAQDLESEGDAQDLQSQGDHDAQHFESEGDAQDLQSKGAQDAQNLKSEDDAQDLESQGDHDAQHFESQGDGSNLEQAIQAYGTQNWDRSLIRSNWLREPDKVNATQFSVTITCKKVGTTTFHGHGWYDYNLTLSNELQSVTLRAIHSYPTFHGSDHSFQEFDIRFGGIDNQTLSLRDSILGIGDHTKIAVGHEKVFDEDDASYLAANGSYVGKTPISDYLNPPRPKIPLEWKGVLYFKGYLSTADYHEPEIKFEQVVVLYSGYINGRWFKHDVEYHLNKESR